MYTNYHTHTERCHHATGTDREYVEMAVARGFDVLGISDHAPYLFDGDYYSNFRMYPDQYPGYIQSFRSLGEEFSSSIRLLVGVELEYYPTVFDRTVRYLAEYGCDYFILGQHFLGLEEMYSGASDDPDRFDLYVRQTIEAMETGLFTYFCHPDLSQLHSDVAVQTKGFRRICETARKQNMPLEFNLLGRCTQRRYPSEAFFRVAAEVGNEVVIGFDAHSPDRLGDPAEWEDALDFLGRLGITPVQLDAERVLSRKSKILSY